MDFRSRRSIVGFVLITTLMAGWAMAPLSAHANPATLDSTCNTTGYRDIPGGGVDVINAVTRDAQGRIVAAGTSDAFGSSDFVVLRFMPDCSLDPTFAPSSPQAPGIDYIDVSGRRAQDEALDVAIQPDGKIVVAGWRESALTEDVAVIRLTTDGSLDPTFDGDGIAVVPNGANERGTSVAIQPDGKILIGGKSNQAGNYDAMLVRLNPNGSLDETFDGDGIRIYSFSANDEQIEDIAVRPDGRIVAVGWATTATADDIAVLQVEPDGAPDTTFGTNGMLLVNISGSSDEHANSVAIRPNGDIVAAGYTNSAGTYDFLALELDPTGTTVGTGIFDVSGGDDRANGVALQADGKAVLTGSAGTNAAVVRTTTAVGTADSTFGNNGIVTINTGGTSVGNDVLIQPDGRIVIVGSNATGMPNFFIARLQGSPPIRLTAGSLAVNENVGNATLTVQRLGATQDAVTVHYATANGTATAPADYTSRSGTLSFAAGETVKTLSVPIVNDATREGPETFTVTLTSPGGGAVLGSPSVAVVTIRTSDQQPDELIRQLGGSWVGNNIYNTTGSGQTIQVSAARSTTRVFYINVTNDGNVTNIFKVRGGGSSSGFAVAYYLGTSSTNITNSILAGTFSTGSLAPGAGRLIRVQIRVSSTATHGAVKSVPITAIWGGDGFRYDVVRANVKVL